MRPRTQATLFVGASLAIHLATFRALEPRSASLVFDPESAAQTIAGETLDLEPEATPFAEAVAGTAAATPPAPAPVPAEGPLPLEGSGGRSPGPAAASSARSTLFGAAGVRFATDLATTFTRSFPQAASADPIWNTSPFGSGGTAEVTLLLNEDGHLAATSVTGTPSPALRQGIARTLVLIGQRTFTARAAATRIRIQASITPDNVHDGVHGDVFALSGGSFSGQLGSAFFALPPTKSGPGRRVDIELRLVR